MNKHQEADQTKAELGKIVHESGRAFHPAMCDADGVADAVKSALSNMMDDRRAEKLGHKVKAYHTIAVRRAAGKEKPHTAVIEISTRLMLVGIDVFAVYIHPSMPHQYLVYVPPAKVAIADNAMMEWLVDPSTRHGATYIIQLIVEE